MRTTLYSRLKPNYKSILEEKAKIISSKLSMLAFVETYINTTPNLKETKEELIASVEKAFENKELQTVIEATVKVVEEQETPKETPKETLKEAPIEAEVEPEVLDKGQELDTGEIDDNLSIEAEENIVSDQPLDALEETLFSSEVLEETPQEEAADFEQIKIHTLEEELKDTIPVDVMANLFEMAQPVSLNDTLTNNIQIGLNDRIAFVKNLFDGSQEDFNRVLSQLNSFKSLEEAKSFIFDFVKPDYDWTNKEEFEERLIQLIERKFS